MSDNRRLLFRTSAEAAQYLARGPRFVGGQLGLVGVLLAGAGTVSLHPRLRLPGGRKAGCVRPSHRRESRLAWHVTRPKAVRPGPDGASRARMGCPWLSPRRVSPHVVLP